MDARNHKRGLTFHGEALLPEGTPSGNPFLTGDRRFLTQNRANRAAQGEKKLTGEAFALGIEHRHPCKRFGDSEIPLALPLDGRAALVVSAANGVLSLLCAPGDSQRHVLSAQDRNVTRRAK